MDFLSSSVKKKNDSEEGNAAMHEFRCAKELSAFIEDGDWSSVTVHAGESRICKGKKCKGRALYKKERYCSFCEKGFGQIAQSNMDKYEDRHHGFVRQKARQVARLLLQVRRRDLSLSEVTLTDLIDPSYFDTIIHAVEELALEGGTETLSLPLGLGNTLKKLIVTVKGVAVRTRNGQLIESANLFQTHMDSEWTDRVSAKSLRKIRDAKINKNVQLPSTEDMVKLGKIVTNQI